MELKERLIEAFKEMRDDELISLWNEYCYASNHYDDEILDYDRLEEWINSSNDTMNILNRFYFGSDEEREGTSANPNRNYFTFNGYGNIISFDYIYNSYTDEFSYIYVNDLASYIEDNEDSLYNDDIQDILDEYNEENAEENEEE